MKKLLLLLVALFLFTGIQTVTAQSKQKAEQNFLKQLNSILKNSKNQHWAYEGVMHIDSAFAINKAGLLSVTLRYTTDSSLKRVRMVAPVGKIAGVIYDIYLILEYKKPLVDIYESDSNSTVLKEAGHNILFHIGFAHPDQGEAQQEKLQKAVDALLKYYKR